jgi:uncharacterized paraquat-inducible protein A
MSKRVLIECSQCGLTSDIIDMTHSKMTLCYSCLADFANGAEIWTEHWEENSKARSVVELSSMVKDWSIGQKNE